MRISPSNASACSCRAPDWKVLFVANNGTNDVSSFDIEPH